MLLQQILQGGVEKMRKALLTVSVLILSCASLFAIPFFGYDVEKEYAKIVESIEDGDGFSKIQSSIEKYIVEYEEESDKLDSKFTKEMDKLEEEADEIFEKFFSAKNASQAEKYYEKGEELDDEMDALESEYSQEREALDDIRPSTFGISLLIYASRAFDGDGSDESWDAAIWILDTFGRSSRVEVIMPGATEAADDTILLSLNRSDLEDRSIDLESKIRTYLEARGIDASSIIISDETGKVVSNPARVSLESPWGACFSAKANVVLQYSFNGIGGNYEVSSQEYDLADTVTFPSVEDDGYILIGWSAGDDVSTLYDNGTERLEAGSIKSDSIYKAQYASFEVSLYAADINGNDNRNGRADINETVNIYPVVKNTGTVETDFTVSIANPGVAGLIFNSYGESVRSFRGVEPGDFVVSAGESSATNRDIGPYLKNYNPKSMYQVKVTATLDGVESVSIPVTVECMGERITKTAELPISRSKVETKLVSCEINDMRGNESGSANPGETITMDFAMLLTSNSDDAYGATIRLTSDSPYIRITNGTLRMSEVEKGYYISAAGTSYRESSARNNVDPTRRNAFSFTVSPDATPGQIPLTVTFTDGLGSSDSFQIPLDVDYVDANISLYKWEYLQKEREDGNGDGKANPGETISIGYLFQNRGSQNLDDVVVRIRSLTSGVRLSTRGMTLSIDELESGRYLNVTGQVDRTNEARRDTGVRYNDGIQVTIPANHPVGTPVEVGWSISGNGARPEGWSGKFSIPVSEPENYPELVDSVIVSTQKTSEALSTVKPGQEFYVEFAARNAGPGTLKNLSWTFSTDSPYISIEDAGPFEAWDDIDSGEIQVSFRRSANSVYSPNSRIDLTNRLGVTSTGMTAKMAYGAPIGSTQNIYINFSDGFATWTECVPVKVGR